MKAKDLIERFIEEMGWHGRPGLKQLQSSHLYCLRRLQKTAFGEKNALTLADDDYVAHVRWRRQTVSAATAMHDITFWRGVVQYARSAWKDCKGLSLAPLVDAMPLLKKYNLVGKSTPRKRRPSAEEFDLLSKYLGERDGRAKIKMLPCLRFAVESTRRRGEICRLQWGDVDFAAHTYMIRDMKHPTKKMGNHKTFPLTETLAGIIKAQPRLSNSPEERVFPYNPQSLGAAYTQAKKALGIKNLRFHDNRREGISRLIEAGLPPHETRLISGHDNTIILEKVYDVRDPAKLVGKLEALDKRKDSGVALW